MPANACSCQHDQPLNPAGIGQKGNPNAPHIRVLPQYPHSPEKGTQPSTLVVRRPLQSPRPQHTPVNASREYMLAPASNPAERRSALLCPLCALCGFAREIPPPHRCDHAAVHPKVTGPGSALPHQRPGNTGISSPRQNERNPLTSSSVSPVNVRGVCVGGGRKYLQTGYTGLGTHQGGFSCHREWTLRC